MDRNKIIKMVVILACIVVIAGSLSRLAGRDSLTLTEYEAQNPAPSHNLTENDSESGEENSSSSVRDAENDKDNGSLSSGKDAENDKDSGSPSSGRDAEGETGSEPSESRTDNDPNPETAPSAPQDDSRPAGAVLNGTSLLEQRVSLNEDFYYEPVSDKLMRYMTGISYPKEDAEESAASPEIGFEELRYVHILHYDFDGNSTEGELICNEFIAQDLVDIFYELYRNEYRLEKVLLIDEYNGDDVASMEDNNTSCFNYRPLTGSTNLSMHAYGLAVDINPFYNPYVAYRKDGTQEVLPASAQAYADRSTGFPYKIDEDDLCYKLFVQHGFIWGGNWNNVKDYQHFQKAKP